MSDVRKKRDVSRGVAAVIEGDDIVATVPDYPLAAQVLANTPAHLRALSDPIRRAIIDLVMERAATTTELAQALGRPKGTVDHHLKVLAKAGIVRVVRTRKVRAMTECYWGRTARTIMFDFDKYEGSDTPPNAVFLREALEEIMATATAGSRHDPTLSNESTGKGYTTLRHARIAAERIEEFAARLHALALEFTATERGGDTVFALLMSMYPTDRPVLPDPRGEP